MEKSLKNIVAVAAVGLLGMSTAQASIIVPGAAGGSEAMLSLVNGANASITQDLGVQIGGVSNGLTIDLSAGVLAFISSAGGFANVTFAVIAGDSTARTYLTSTTDASLATVDIANSERSVWSSTVTQLTGDLNAGDASATSANNTYGPFATGAAGNYIDGGYDLWKGSYVINTGPGDNTLSLYKVVFGTNNLLNGAVCPFFVTDSAHCGDDPASSNSVVKLLASTNQIQFGTTVPAPGAVWLLGTGLLGLFGRRAHRAASA